MRLRRFQVPGNLSQTIDAFLRLRFGLGQRFFGIRQLLIQRGTILEPTIFVIQHSSDHAPDDEEKARRSRRLEFANEITNLAYRNGIPIAAGSDNMSAEDDDLHDAVARLRKLRESGAPLQPGLAQLTALVNDRLAASGPI